MRRLLPALMVCVTCMTAAAAQGDDARIADKQQQLRAVQERIESINKSLRVNQQQQSALEGELRELQLNLSASLKSLRNIRQQTEETRARLADLQTQRSGYKRQLDIHRRTLTAQLRAAYLMGNQEQLKLLLNQQEPSALARMMKYYEYLTRARLASIRGAEETLQQLNQTQTAINAAQTRLDNLLREEEKSYAEMQRTRKQQQAVLAKLQAEMAAGNQSISGLRRDEAHIQELIASLKGLFADIPSEATSSLSFAQQRGHLDWPARGALLNRFDELRAGSDLRWHGLSIEAAAGTEVRAVSHGRVVFADWLPGFGLLLIIDHGGGYMSLYGHNQALYKETGDWVNGGEVIASVGQGLGDTRSSVYFEIRHNGKPEDPAAWCRPARA